MKSIVVLCVVLVAGIQAFVTLPPNQYKITINNEYACIKESGVSAEAFAEGRKGNLIDDERLKKFIHCLGEKAGIFTSDGKLNIDVAQTRLPPGIDKVAGKELLESCQSKTEKDATATVYETLKCYFKGIKVLIHLKVND